MISPQHHKASQMFKRVCGAEEEATALSRPALSALQDALHQQDEGGGGGGGRIPYIRLSDLTFKEHGRESEWTETSA